MKLGLVTYNLAKDWDIPTIIERCSDAGFEGVELRTTHAHGVEPCLSKTEREKVRKQFRDSPVSLAGLGTAFEFHSQDPLEVRRNIEGAKEFVRLAHDVGAPGVKVRPNGFCPYVPRWQTIDQIGAALRECGSFALDFGVQIRLEVHGKETCHPENIRKMMDSADQDNVFVCWNSNPGEAVDGSVRAGFELLKNRISLVHITDLYSEYPWRELFVLLRGIGYSGYCLAEITESGDPLRVMRYYRALFEALCQ